MSGTQHISDSANPGNLPEDKLLAYLGGTLTGDELHKVELMLAGEGMESDALEGLQGFDAMEAKAVARKLNNQLQQSLKKKKRRSRREMVEQRWAWIAVAIILLITVVAFIVIWIMRQQS